MIQIIKRLFEFLSRKHQLLIKAALSSMGVILSVLFCAYSVTWGIPLILHIVVITIFACAIKIFLDLTAMYADAYETSN